VTAAATADDGINLGELATVTDAEILGIAGVWAEGYSRTSINASIRSGHFWCTYRGLYS